MLDMSFSLNDLKTMEVIDVSIGAKVGYINDFVIDTDTLRVLSIIVSYTKGSWFFKNNYLEIPWDKIINIGLDVILVDGSNIDLLLEARN